MKHMTAWYIWLLAGLFYLYEFIHRVAPSVMVPELMQDFSASSAAVGSISAFYYYSYSFIQIPVGILLDRYGTKYMLSFAAFSITIGSFLFASTSSIEIAKFGRLLIGFGSAFSFVGCLKLGTNWFPSHKFAFIVGLTSLLGSIGAILGGEPLALLVDILSWRTVMSYSVIIAIIFTVLLYLFIEDKPNQKSNINNLNNNYEKFNNTIDLNVFINNLVTILKSKQLWLISIIGSCMVAPIAAYSEIWGVTFIIHSYKLSRPLAAQISSLIFVGIAIGGPVIGWFSDYIKSIFIPLFIGIIMAIISFGFIVYSSNLPIIMFKILHLSFGFFTSSMLLCFSLTKNCVNQYNQQNYATAIGFVNTVIVGLSAISQPVVGWLLDRSILLNQKYNFTHALMGLTLCQVIALIAACLLVKKVYSYKKINN